MADAVVHVKIADMEPFKRFIAQVAEAHAHFYGLTPDEVKALPVRACRGIASLQEALCSIGLEPTGPVGDAPATLLDERFRLAGDEDCGVGAHCRDCETGGAPIAYYSTVGLGYDPGIPTVTTVADLLAAMRTHETEAHGSAQNKPAHAEPSQRDGIRRRP